MLFIFGGLPGTGKTILSQYLAESIGATYLRIDSIEQTLRNEGILEVEGKGYEVAYRIAHDNLKTGQSVVADSVNPLPITRKAWRSVASETGSTYCEIEIICSDKSEHRQRIESRVTDIDGLRLPSWQDVLGREYEPWIDKQIGIDTANKSVRESKEELMTALRNAAVI